MTLDPGRPYRIVFTGVGFHFKVQVYDLLDLTKPLLQMEADDVDVTYTNGVCGLMPYSRNDEAGVTDVTVDNYQIGGSDPNPATAPALAHPVAGTPTIETRIPAERFRNCYDPSGGISFAASTYTSDVIDASATKLRLNGVDVSSQLVLSTNGPNISGSLPGSALNSYTVYSAQIEVQDVTGHKKSTNTFWFDTFSDACLSSADVKIIEAEEYNYSNGVFQLDPIAVSGPDLDGIPVAGDGVGYFDLHGVEGVDFHDSQTAPEPLWAGEFRQFDPAGLSQGMYPEIEDSNDPFAETRYSDKVRNKYVTNNMLEFVVHRTEPGEWLNYTRDFDGGSYNAYLRVASLGPSEVLLDQVASDPTLPGQTTANLGKVSIPNQFARYNYRYIPLVDNSGSPVVLNLSGTMTLRLTMAGTPGQDNDKLAIELHPFCSCSGHHPPFVVGDGGRLLHRRSRRDRGRRQPDDYRSCVRLRTVLQAEFGNGAHDQQLLRFGRNRYDEVLRLRRRTKRPSGCFTDLAGASNGTGLCVPVGSGKFANDRSAGSIRRIPALTRQER